MYGARTKKGRRRTRHRHVQLISGRARKAQEYPRKLCEAIVEGIRKQIECDEWGVVKVNLGDKDLKKRISEVMAVTRQTEGAPGHDEDDGEGGQDTWAWDDITGAQLNAEKVRDARKEEIGYIRQHKVYKKVRRSSVPEGAKVIQVRWIDINKGDETNVDIRSRLVAKDFNTEDRPDLFAATPPIEAMRIIISEAATSGGEEKAIMVNDVRRAFFYAKALSPVWVELPDED